MQIEQAGVNSAIVNIEPVLQCLICDVFWNDFAALHVIFILLLGDTKGHERHPTYKTFDYNID